MLNPERGFYKTFNLVGSNPAAAAASIRSAGYTLAYAQINLKPYRTSPIPDSFLTALNNGFAGVRSGGIKLIVRPVYSDDSDEPDAPLSKILQDIERLKETLLANRDVIFLEQAGYIGAWGEWHSSTSGNDNTNVRSQVLLAMLKTLPGRTVSLRTPMFKDAIFPNGPLTARQRSLRGRTGHFNDCFLSSSDDYGTYDDPVDDWEDYVSQDTLYVPMGGETCNWYAPRGDCGFAVGEMERNHWSYLNSEYNQAVYDKWKQQGCFQQVYDRLGYRFTLKSSSFSGVKSKAGQALDFTLQIENEGFASLVNARPVYIVFDNGVSSGNVNKKVKLEEDPRLWAAGKITTLDKTITVPNLPKGTYIVSLWLPDHFLSLRQDPRYSICLTDTGAWNNIKGWNRLGSLIVE